MLEPAELRIRLSPWEIQECITEISERELEFCDQRIQSIKENLKNSDLKSAEIAIKQLDDKIIEFNNWHVQKQPGQAVFWFPIVQEKLNPLREALKKKTGTPLPKKNFT